MLPPTADSCRPSADTPSEAHHSESVSERHGVITTSEPTPLSSVCGDRKGVLLEYRRLERAVIDLPNRLDQAGVGVFE